MDTVENELFFCLENRRVPRAEMEERLSAALDFCGIAHLRRRPLRSLSGGGEAAGRAGLSGRPAAGLGPAGRALRQFGRPNRRPLPLRAARPAPPGMRHRHSGHRPPAGPLAVHRRRDPPSWPRTARWTAPPMPPAPSPLRRGRSGASASPAAPTRPPGRSRPGRRRWCSPAGLRVSQDGREVLRDVNADFFRGAHPRHRGPQRQRQEHPCSAPSAAFTAIRAPPGWRGWSCPGTAAG